MVKLNGLGPASGARKYTKRIGRGTGSGSGSTSGHGNNGAKSRSGDREKLYFEGGQTPMTRRIPKRGFNNADFTRRYQIINVADIEKLDPSVVEIDPLWLKQHGLIGSSELPVKILGTGELTKKITVRANSFSKSAREKIEKAKGKVEVIERA